VIVALVVWLWIATMPDWFLDLPTPAKITGSIVAFWALIEAIEGLFERYHKYGPTVARALEPYKRTVRFLTAGAVGVGVVVAMVLFLRPGAPIQPNSRLRVWMEEVGPAIVKERDGLAALNVYYATDGPVPLNAIAYRVRVITSSAGLPDYLHHVTQDEILALKEWPQLMASQELQELHSTDKGRFFTLGANNQEGAEFRRDYDTAKRGDHLLNVYVTFKYRDKSLPKNTIVVTERCVWFRFNSSQHNCGRVRTFTETR
jgi:hypothetical protein